MTIVGRVRGQPMKHLWLLTRLLGVSLLGLLFGTSGSIHAQVPERDSELAGAPVGDGTQSRLSEKTLAEDGFRGDRWKLVGYSTEDYPICVSMEWRGVRGGGCGTAQDVGLRPYRFYLAATPDGSPAALFVFGYTSTDIRSARIDFRDGSARPVSVYKSNGVSFLASIIDSPRNPDVLEQLVVDRVDGRAERAEFREGG